MIDSLAGFEMALAPGFRTDFRESLYRMIGALTRRRHDREHRRGRRDLHRVGAEQLTVSFLSDDIIRLRYVEINGQLRKVLMVVKMRAATTARTWWSTRSRPRAWSSASRCEATAA